MTIREMVKRVNTLTGQGIYSIDDLLPYFDEAIDEVNDILNSNLPPISAIFNNDFSKEENEEELDFFNQSLDNQYTRIPETYMRNYICYEVSFRVLRDEDEDPEVYNLRAGHANKWLRKIQSNLGVYTMSVGDTILVNDDVTDEMIDDQFYNPYFLGDDE